ncbi:hypothetical protein ACGF5O_48840 [Streptomyces sp. NPDC048291]|uniref:hypothetical protein n=1 Tax=Streptomyces sp. NPDC048291 TaxID=3365530 RepID=UPI00371F3B3A
MGVAKRYLSKAEVQRLLGVNGFGWWRLVRKYESFPEPEERPVGFAALGDEESEEVWDGTHVYKWAAEIPEFAHRGALLLRPLPEVLAPGAWAGYRDTVRGPALDWHTGLGTIRIVHSDERKAASDVASAVVKSGKLESVVSVCALFGDMGFTGPALVAADTAHPDIEYEASWGDVAALAGTDLPWWPDLLRLPQVIRLWQPGTKATVVAVPPNEQETVLRRAADNKAFDDAARAAVTDVANDIRNNRIDHTRHDNEIFGKRGHGTKPNPVVIGAVPDTAGHPLPCDTDPRTLRAGWRALAGSSHPDAVAALEVATVRDPSLLPFGAVTEVPVRSGTVYDRWAQRLTLCDPTAAHAVLAQGERAQSFLIDPLTDMPVLRIASSKNIWRFYAPLSLPAAGEELAAVVLHHTLWIVTSGGQVHPAPCTPHEHLWWGDGWGDRPSEAALVTDALLDDLGTAVDLREHWKAPEGLTALFDEQHKQGTELSRSTLLHARMTPPRTR